VKYATSKSNTKYPITKENKITGDITMGFDKISLKI
jgi:hypothetical protein